MFRFAQHDKQTAFLLASCAIRRYQRRMPITVATWNINSVRLRAPLVARFVKEHTPDILCLQETKTPDEHFPFEAVREMGYNHIAISGEKGYNGVAILSRIPFSDSQRMDILGNGSKRHIAVTLPGGVSLHNFYVPAGGDIPDPEANPKFEEKLRFVERMREWSGSVKKGGKTIIVGDFNIAPYEHDVWSHKQLLKIVSHTPVETEALARLRETIQWIDTARESVPLDKKLYSWWSYRNRDWSKSDRGRRLDHIWASPGLKSAVLSSRTLRDVRNWDGPSDHVPVITGFDL